jgi:hypothetical protein
MNKLLQIDGTPEELQNLGPSLRIIVEPILTTSEIQRIDGVLAIIDTGATRSCISDRLLKRFISLPVIGKRREISAVARETEYVPTYRCKVLYPCGIEAKNDFSVLPHLSEPHDMLIGCDMLAHSQLIIDFPSGKWCISFNL